MIYTDSEIKELQDHLNEVMSLINKELMSSYSAVAVALHDQEDERDVNIKIVLEVHGVPIKKFTVASNMIDITELSYNISKSINQIITLGVHRDYVESKYQVNKLLNEVGL